MYTEELATNGQVAAEEGRSLVLGAAEGRRLYRLYVKAAVQVELANASRIAAEQARDAFNEGLAEVFETAGIPFQGTESYQIDWRQGRVTLGAAVQA